MENRATILTTAYLPPIQYFTKIVSSNKVLIEVNETYSKQSYRNRCMILSSNGTLPLSIPVIKTQGNHTLTKDIKIDYSTRWQKNHWGAIISAYKTSAYFDFIADIIYPYYEKRVEFLVDFNQRLADDILQFIGHKKTVQHTEEFRKSYPDEILDCRFSIHPKPQLSGIDPCFIPVKYFQVFSDRFDFVPNLCIIDLLFNEGLNSIEVLQESTKNLPENRQVLIGKP